MNSMSIQVEFKRYTLPQSILLRITQRVHFLDSVVDESSSERLLGVIINNDLSWNTHIENVIKQCNTFLYLLSRI